MQAVYALTLRQLSGKWRLIIMIALAAMPVILTMSLLSDNDAISVGEFEALMLSSILTGSILPLVVLAIAAAAFGNELDDRTLANLTISPVPRWKIALGKLLAAITVAAPFIAVSALVTGHIAFIGDTRATVAITAGAIAGVAMYASLFVWLGLVSTQAVGLGLLYIVLWEGFFSGYIEGVRLLSIRFYSLALMHAIDERRFVGTQITPTAAMILTAAVIGGFLFLTNRRLRAMDVP